MSGVITVLDRGIWWFCVCDFSAYLSICNLVLVFLIAQTGGKLERIHGIMKRCNNCTVLKYNGALM